MSQLELRGYLHIKQVLDPFVLETAAQILKDNQGLFEENQEEPLERVGDPDCLLALRKIQKLAFSKLEDVIQREVQVPKHWDQTTWVRRKLRFECTHWHEDFQFFSGRGFVDSRKNRAYTVWIPLTARTSRSSRLELSIGSKTIDPDVQMGDILVFHSTVRHRATVHEEMDPRFSLDCRAWISEA